MIIIINRSYKLFDVTHADDKSERTSSVIATSSQLNLLRANISKAKKLFSFWLPTNVFRMLIERNVDMTDTKTILQNTANGFTRFVCRKQMDSTLERQASKMKQND